MKKTLVKIQEIGLIPLISPFIKKIILFIKKNQNVILEILIFVIIGFLLGRLVGHGSTCGGGGGYNF